jgi:uracil DNA glycosylase
MTIHIGPNAFAVLSPHPMARSKVGFARSQPFSIADHGLIERGADPIGWRLDG